jgi:protein-tyrosine phosphatase
MAMGLFHDRVRENIDDWQIDSAGTWALEGEPPMDYVQELLHQRDIDISRHLSQQVSEQLLSQFNLILTMERGQKEGLKVEFPKLANRIYLFSEMVGQVFDIRDPVGGPAVEYAATLREIEQLITKGFDRINQLADRR